MQGVQVPDVVLNGDGISQNTILISGCKSDGEVRVLIKLGNFVQRIKEGLGKVKSELVHDLSDNCCFPLSEQDWQ